MIWAGFVFFSMKGWLFHIRVVSSWLCSIFCLLGAQGFEYGRRRAKFLYLYVPTYLHVFAFA